MKNGETPLYIVAENCHLEICRELIERGANIDLPLKVRTTLISSTLIYKEAWRTPSQKPLEILRLNRFTSVFLSFF